MPLLFKAAMILSMVRFDSPVLAVIEVIDVLASDAKSCTTAISFCERCSLNDNGISETPF